MIFSTKKTWQSSKSHLLLLSKFLSPRVKDDFINSEVWSEVLNEPIEKVIKTFLKDGLLREADLQEKINAKFKVKDLKSLLKTRNLPVTGKKALLIERLIQADKGGMEYLVSGIDVLICSDKGEQIAEEYLEKEREIRLATEHLVLSSLLKGNYHDACMMVANFEAEQVFQRGIGIDWINYNPKSDEYILKLIFSKSPKILNEYSQEQIKILRPASAMMHLWGVNVGKQWIPTDFDSSHKINPDTAIRMILFHALFLSSISRYKKSNFKFVEILTVPDSCENCKKHAGKIFDIDSVPELPNAECTHEKGCRCCIVPKIR